MKKSGVYKRQGMCFRYDYENCLVSWVAKATKQELEDNEEWQRKHGRNLWEFDEKGYQEIKTVGLSKENWKNKEVRDGYLDQWIDEIEAETTYLVDEFLRFG